tara:strand:+ start:10930 stop:11613 length:684 start_codon:yes stop_codon:yes gene_type:complete
MTRIEMHAEFKLLMDKGDSFDAPSFLEEEIDSFLNISQEKFISKRAFGNNTRRTNFEEDQKRRDDLRTLISNAIIVPSAVGQAHNKPNGQFVALPENYRHAINEEAAVETVNQTGSARVGVKPITHDRYNKIIDDPFNKPNKHTVYRLDFGGTGFDNNFELICGNNQVVSEYHLRYIKNPLLIEPDVDCSLAEHTHKEIVRMAVVDALENVEQPRYQSSKIELNEIE